MNKELQKIFIGYDSFKELDLQDGYCGPGSTLWYTKPLRSSLVAFLKKHNINSMLDAPCGCHQWMSKVILPDGFEYIGGDIGESLIARNKLLYDRNFQVLDITDDELPGKDLMMVRDCLFHFSNDFKIKFFNNFIRSNCKFLLTSAHPRNMSNGNSTMREAYFEQVNWQLPPWNFPTPIDLIVDYEEGNPLFAPYPYRTMELYSKSQISLS